MTEPEIVISADVPTDVLLHAACSGFQIDNLSQYSTDDTTVNESLSQPPHHQTCQELFNAAVSSRSHFVNGQQPSTSAVSRGFVS